VSIFVFQVTIKSSFLLEHLLDGLKAIMLHSAKLQSAAEFSGRNFMKGTQPMIQTIYAQVAKFPSGIFDSRSAPTHR
jgi:hypothetical protein